MAVRERKGADWFGRLSGEWGRFPMNPRVVEGCRCPGESFESNGELGGGRKWPDRRWRQGARREKLAGVIPTRTGSFRRSQSKTRVAGDGGYLFPVSDGLIGGQKWLIGAGRGGGVRGEERERGKGLVGILPQMQTSFFNTPLILIT